MEIKKIMENLSFLMKQPENRAKGHTRTFSSFAKDIEAFFIVAYKNHEKNIRHQAIPELTKSLHDFDRDARMLKREYRPIVLDNCTITTIIDESLKEIDTLEQQLYNANISKAMYKNNYEITLEKLNDLKLDVGMYLKGILDKDLSALTEKEKKNLNDNTKALLKSILGEL